MGKEGTVGWEEGDIAEDRDEDSAAPPGPANLRLHSGSSTAEFITSSHHVFFFFFFQTGAQMALHRCSIISLTISSLWIFKLFLIFKITNRAAVARSGPCAQVAFELDFGNSSQKMFLYPCP